MINIMIDAGHGPETAGKRSPDGVLREFGFTSAVADLVKKILTAEGVSISFAHNGRERCPASRTD